ncbi:MAG TPA: hypothetical protein CFH84_00500 [Sulfurimonas sp. UBA12504]|nr:MAG: hypothetical protein A2019_07960 [Sulfurimonas sp. GWF2_37_8]DAB31087.1 MAG TPA: hypothetical protein CFH84_00500 [Sulfurimonas sp. UBA12504]
MKVFLLGLFLSVSLFADFYIINGSEKVKMSTLETGVIDFATFKDIAHVKRSDAKLHAYGKEIAFNHKHLNFRLVTIALKQQNYTISEWSQKAQNASDEYYINFADYTREDGYMLQLFYKNKWYAVVLGEPLEILHKLFDALDVNDPNLDVTAAMKAVKQARAAFVLDPLFQKVAIELENRYINDLKSRKNYNQQERVEFKK